MNMPHHWAVVGDASRGIPVYVGRSSTSARFPEVLQSGSILEEREFVDGRLRYRKLNGIGPLTGWVNTGAYDACGLEVQRISFEADERQASPAQLPRPDSEIALRNEADRVDQADIDPIETGTRSLYSYRRVIGPRNPVSLAQWYNDLDDQRAVVDHGVTSIKWTTDGNVWHDVAENWVVHQQTYDAQVWDLNEMDVVSGVEVEHTGVQRSAGQPIEVRGAIDMHCCIKCIGCVRPPGHHGLCLNARGDELTPPKPKPKPPPPGVYLGLAKDVSCPGDDVTYEIILRESGLCSMSCAPKMSLFAGGQPPWSCEGVWEFDAPRLNFIVTKEDFMGPKEEEEVPMDVALDGQSLTFKDAVCEWQRLPPLPEDLDLSGWWKLTPSADDADVVHFMFHHEPKSKTFTGYQNDFDQIFDGRIEGDTIEWSVDAFRVKGRLASDGTLLVDVQVRSVLDSEFIVLYNGTRSEDPEEGVCAVCLENLVFRDGLRRLPCDHLFHAACVEQWLVIKNHCPTCRSVVR